MVQDFFPRSLEKMNRGGSFYSSFREMLPRITANGFSSGGEIIEIIKPHGVRPRAILVLTDGTKKEIRTQEGAHQAIKLVSQENQRRFEHILIENNLITNRVFPTEPEPQVHVPFSQREARAPVLLEAHESGFEGRAHAGGLSFSRLLSRVVVNGIVVGSEQIEIIQSRGRPSRGTLILQDGTRQNIRTQAEAQLALRRVLPENHLRLQRILIEHRLLASSLEELIANNPIIQTLYLKINELRDHALGLAELDPDRSNAGISLADNFEAKANQFLTNTLESAPTEEEFAQFKEDFEALAEDTDTLLGRHRAIWKPIIANIFVALTGIGAILIICKLIYKAATDAANMKFNNSFFFAQTKLEHTKTQLIHQVNYDLYSTLAFTAIRG